MQIAKNIEKLREEKELLQKEVANWMKMINMPFTASLKGCSPKAISKISLNKILL